MRIGNKKDMTSNVRLPLGLFSLYPYRKELIYREGYVNSQKTFTLSRGQLAILVCLMSRLGTDVPTLDILDSLYGEREWSSQAILNGTRTLPVYMVRLKHCLKLDPTLKITNIRGFGYRLDYVSL